MENSLIRFDHSELYFGGLLFTKNIFPALEASVGNPEGQHVGAWQSLAACGTQPELRGLAGSGTPVLLGREGTCLLPLGWEAGFAAATVRMEMCWACKECLLHRLLSSCEVRAPLLTSGMVVSR